MSIDEEFDRGVIESIISNQNGFLAPKTRSLDLEWAPRDSVLYVYVIFFHLPLF